MEDFSHFRNYADARDGAEVDAINLFHHHLRKWHREQLEWLTPCLNGRVLTLQADWLASVSKRRPPKYNDRVPEFHCWIQMPDKSYVQHGWHSSIIAKCEFSLCLAPYGSEGRRMTKTRDVTVAYLRGMELNTLPEMPDYLMNYTVPYLRDCRALREHHSETLRYVETLLSPFFHER